ncbi:MAG: tyrosine-type recombinase/integrase [Clostridia bacterium]|nr:tyrosine-type recombinase/integrase [Clostridia bacterium]MDY5263710.1 tyrosine-type recombinase/integrase [Eubacteriales bacterium]
MKYNGKTIIKRTDGRYFARYTDENGKRVSVYGRTQQECVNKLKLHLKLLKKRKLDKLQGNEKPSQYLLYDWLDYWNETFKKPINKTDNVSRYIRLHIKGKIANKPLSDVTTFDIQECINLIAGCGKMRKEVQDVFNGAFRVAFVNGLIKDNPTLRLTKPRYDTTKGIALTEEEQNNFIEKIKDHPDRDVFLLFIMTGARRTELLNITSGDIDFEKGVLHLRGTKSKNADRKVILCDTALKILRNNVKENPTEKLFKYTADHYTKVFKKLCPNHTLHDLRHTFGTRSNENDVDMKVVQKLMGHSSYKITADTYTSVFSPTITRETKKVNDYFDSNFGFIFDTKIDTDFDTTNQKN